MRIAPTSHWETKVARDIDRKLVFFLKRSAICDLNGVDKLKDRVSSRFLDGRKLKLEEVLDMGPLIEDSAKGMSGNQHSARAVGHLAQNRRLVDPRDVAFDTVGQDVTTIRRNLDPVKDGDARARRDLIPLGVMPVVVVLGDADAIQAGEPGLLDQLFQPEGAVRTATDRVDV